CPTAGLSAVVLDVSLNTVQQTFEEAWHFATLTNSAGWRSGEIVTDSDHLQLLPGMAHRRGLRWILIDFAANWDKKIGLAPGDVRNQLLSPHSAVLWAASYFPEWVQAMDGITVPYVWIPGYVIVVPGAERLQMVPYLALHRSLRKLTLGIGTARSRDTYWAVPAR